MPTTTNGTLTAVAQTVSASNLKDTVINVIIYGTYSNVEMISEATVDGVIYFPLGMTDLETGIIIGQTGIRSNKTFAIVNNFATRNITTYRIRAVSFGTGTVNVKILTSKSLIEPAPLENLVHGQTVVGVAGTAVILLSGSTITHTLTITAKSSNTGNIFIGLIGVTAGTGYILPPGGSISLDHNHAGNNIYVNSAVNGEGVSYIGSLIV